MATFNRGAVVVDCLKRTVAAATASVGTGHFNVIVVDNASSDNTAELVGALAAEERHIKLVRLTKNCGPVAKNVGLYENAADILVLLDDDAYPLPGALGQMVRHFQDDANLGAAEFDVMLPDGRKEASAYPDVFIGAGTALRGAALRELAGGRRPGRGLLPADFFMAAEEYDLSFRLVAAGWSVQRFWDMPLLHLKAPGARIGQRITQLDVRNNLWLLARYVPEPWCTELAADWLARYWRMALQRDEAGGGEHRAAYLRGAASGLSQWRTQRGSGELLLPTEALERIFRFEAIRQRLARAKEAGEWKRIAFGDWGKNLLAYYRAACELDLEVAAVVDGNLAGDTEAAESAPVEYRGVPVIDTASFLRMQEPVDAVVVTAMARVHAERRAGELRRTLRLPVVDLFSPGGRTVRTGVTE
jgi:glycosyltransferase involved in cell wall biosynthesis